jgi:hypothetical protein
MSDDAAGFIGTIPQHYDQGLGPMIFVDYAADIARRVASSNPARVLETGRAISSANAAPYPKTRG